VFSGGVTAPVPVETGGSVTFEFDRIGVYRSDRGLMNERPSPISAAAGRQQVSVACEAFTPRWQCP